MLGYGYDRYLANVLLPQGQVALDYAVCVRVDVMDVLLAKQTVVLKIKVFVSH